jgi:hypothetical protein
MHWDGNYNGVNCKIKDEKLAKTIISWDKLKVTNKKQRSKLNYIYTN